MGIDIGGLLRDRHAADLGEELGGFGLKSGSPPASGEPLDPVKNLTPGDDAQGSLLVRLAALEA
jgi:hypothetical protein